MKTNLLTLILICVGSSVAAQVTSPAIRANFGVDADLSANYFNGFVQSDNDDWFMNNQGTGAFIIDTTGATYLLQQYNSNPASRMFPFFRGMRYPQLSVINNKLLVDAIFIRDHHGDDSTVFAAGSNKNGQNPAIWTTPISQGIPDKTDILDMYMHVRHDGPSLNDSLWLFGGVSLDATTGNRYFDFEMYQTDITYNRPTLSFSGYGPDAGHTSWQFDASGNLLAAGDVIFTAEYGSSSLTYVKARIWVHKDALLTTPAAFNWEGTFDGASASSTYGYAGIVPKSAGVFYTGTQSSNNTWAGAFKLVLQNNSVVDNYSARQFMEFSVNLTKLGLDFIVNPTNPCAMPFRRILVKSRSSTSFNAELKDFVGPFDFFRAPRASASATIPFFCGNANYSEINVDNPLPTSLYTWTTPDGNITSSNVGPSITINQPGSYIVDQQLMDSCGVSYARDTVVVFHDPNCMLLPVNIKDFHLNRKAHLVNLAWRAENPASFQSFELERKLSSDHFRFLARINADENDKSSVFRYSDNIETINSDKYQYRLKIRDKQGNITYSKILTENSLPFRNSVDIISSPVSRHINLVIHSLKSTVAMVQIYDISGMPVRALTVRLNPGKTVKEINSVYPFKPGMYVVKVQFNNQFISKKMIIQ